MSAAFTIEGLDQVLNLLRKHGARSFKMVVDGQPMEVEFGHAEWPRDSVRDDASPLAPRPTLKQMLDSEGAGVCACSHDVLEHTKDGCLQGCDFDKCEGTA